MRVLVMGGTQFNGLALVHQLVAAGHDVTVCNRGRTEADIPPTVARLVADRTDHEQLRQVLGGTWTLGGKRLAKYFQPSHDTTARV